MAINNKDKSIIKASIYFILFYICMSPQLVGQEAQQPITQSGDSLSNQQLVRKGQLPNGFTYFIKPLSTPNNKLHLRLYHKAGQNQESYRERGFTHALEHLAFKSTRNFPHGLEKDSIVRKMNMGVYDFSGLNGTLSTEFIFDAPQNSEEILETGLAWFKDITTNLTLSKKDIDDVRGELRQEFVLRMGENGNEVSAEIELLSKLFPCVEDYKDYLEHLSTFNPEELRQFYRDWYRPELMALSVVGEIKDIDQLEKKIKEIFSSFTSQGFSKALKNCEDEYFEQPSKFVIVERNAKSFQDKLLDQVELYTIFRNPEVFKNSGMRVDQRQLIITELLASVINSRLKEITSEYCSFTAGVHDWYNLSGLPPTLTISTTVDNELEKESFQKVFQILNQINVFGITESEFSEMKAKHNNYLLYKKEKDAQSWNSSFNRHFVWNEALPSDGEDDLLQWLSDYDLSDFNRFAQQFLSKQPEDLAIIAPKGHPALLYTETDIRSWIEEVQETSTPRYLPPKTPENLLSPNQIKKLDNIGFKNFKARATGATEIILDNGIKVVLKKTGPPSKSNLANIYIRGFTKKGASSFSVDMYSSAINAPGIVINAGVNDLSKFEINRFLADHSLLLSSVTPYIDYDEAGIEAKGSFEQLETIFQMIYLYFVKPNKSKEAFDDWKLQQLRQYQSPSANLTKTDFLNNAKDYLKDYTLPVLLGAGRPEGTEAFESILETDMNKAYSIYKTLFGNANQFTFLISGQFEYDFIIPLIQKYLGNLPNRKDLIKTGSCNKVEEIEPGPVLKKFPAPEYYEIKNTVYGIWYVLKAKEPTDWKEQLRIEALGGVLNNKVWALRIKKGYSLYSLGAAGENNTHMQRFEVKSIIEPAPEELEAIRQEYRQMVSEIKNGDISDYEFSQGLDWVKFMHSVQWLSQPRIVNQRLYNHYKYDYPWIEPEEEEEFVNSLNIKDIIKVGNKIFKEENLYEFIMEGK